MQIRSIATWISSWTLTNSSLVYEANILMSSAYMNILTRELRVTNVGRSRLQNEEKGGERASLWNTWRTCFCVWGRTRELDYEITMREIGLEPLEKIVPYAHAFQFCKKFRMINLIECLTKVKVNYIHRFSTVYFSSPFSKRRDQLCSCWVSRTESKLLLRNEIVSFNPFKQFLCNNFL